MSSDTTEDQRSAEQLRATIDAAPIGMLMVDRAGRIVSVNSQVERIFGYSREELMNEPVEMLVPERFRAGHSEYRSDYFHGPGLGPMGKDRDLCGLRKDGTEIPIEIRLSLLQTSEGEFVLSSVADITERKQEEREKEDLMGELTTLNGDLEERLRRREISSHAGPPAERATRRTTVLLADDHAIVREGLVGLLKERDFEVVGAVGDGHQLIDAARRLRPDVILTDLSMPGLSGLDVLARLKAERIDSKVIVLTMHNDADLATRATRGGASGFVVKHSAGEELVTAIHEALQGRVYLTPAVTREVIERLSASQGQSEPQLTERQREVLRLIMAGQRMKEIAVVLHLSTRTVETHKYAMMRSLGVSSTAELVRYAIEHRLIVE